MSDYPNMSYCQFQNVKLGLEQCLDTLQLAAQLMNATEEEKDEAEFEALSFEEEDAMQAMVNLCETFLEAAEEYNYMKEES